VPLTSSRSIGNDPITVFLSLPVLKANIVQSPLTGAFFLPAAVSG
jgi:hypothetical protein